MSSVARLTIACTGADGQLLVARKFCLRTMRLGSSWAALPFCPSAR